MSPAKFLQKKISMFAGTIQSVLLEKGQKFCPQCLVTVGGLRNDHKAELRNEPGHVWFLVVAMLMAWRRSRESHCG